ncbi:uncharacterized protein CG4449 isoform X2 [Bradysia coprophila]|uniref:uncharacterized protein CG4449 isoform X2 n=1 Tax=Bradysia coprophila TaxID=38358 RepID=UPI00187D8BB5|nr:uncharacterized protein CG4449 isoform X2 [Bradysia coprophila]
MASLNLFANIDNFDDANYSIGEFNIDDDDVVVELPEEKVSPKVAAKSKKGKGKDSDAPVVVPGIGQKTAFKKLSKLKESLANTTVSDPIKFRTRSAMNAGIRQAFETQQARKRFRLTELDEISFVDEAPLVQQSLQSANTNDSFDEDELSVNVKIRWEGTSKIEKMEFSMYKSFKELIDRLSMRDKIDAKSFLLMLGDQVIKPDDSPHSIGYTLGKFISVRVVDNPHLYLTGSSSQTKANTIEVKIQSSQWKNPMICNIKPSDQFKVLIGMCSEKLKCHPNKIRFKFDGDILNTTSTPNDHDFEGGEIIDLLMSD